VNKSCDDIVLFSRHEPEFSAEPTPADRCVRDRPEQRTWHHYSSPDGKFLCGLWEADQGCWRVNYTEHEFCRILEGVSVLRDSAGHELRVGAGDDFTIPAGFAGQWDVIERTRKLYVIYLP
jgi:hypothetical protein